MTIKNLARLRTNLYKPYVFLFLFSILVSHGSYGQGYDKQHLFIAVFFGDFFKNDTVDVIIADSPVLKNVILTSSLADGSANTEIYVYKYEGNLFFIKTMDNDVLPFKALSEITEIDIVLNKKRFKFQFDINKGGYISFAKDEDKIFSKQSRKLPVFD